MFENKRGQGLSVNAIILIILGVVILVVLIAGFAFGWSAFAPWMSKENVRETVSSCKMACDMNEVYGFCSRPTELIDDQGNTYRDISCHALSIISETEKYAIETCNRFECDDINFVMNVDNKEQACQAVGEGAEFASYFEIAGKVKTFTKVEC